MMERNGVCLFFYVHRKFLIHGCSLEEAEMVTDTYAHGLDADRKMIAKEMNDSLQENRNE